MNKFQDVNGRGINVGARVAYIVEPYPAGEVSMSTDVVVGLNEDTVPVGGLPCVFFEKGGCHLAKNVSRVA